MNIRIKKEEKSEFIGQIIDIFDDFLEERGIRVPTSDREMKKDEDLEGNEARIYGSDYGELQEKLETLCANWAGMPERKEHEASKIYFRGQCIYDRTR